MERDLFGMAGEAIGPREPVSQGTRPPSLHEFEARWCDVDDAGTGARVVRGDNSVAFVGKWRDRGGGARDFETADRHRQLRIHDRV